MVESAEIERARNDRLSLAMVLTKESTNVSFSSKQPVVIVHSMGDMKTKYHAMLWRADENDAEILSISDAYPNFQSWSTKSKYHRDFMSDNLDSLLISWCDPSHLKIPVSYSSDIWTTVSLHSKEDREIPETTLERYRSNIRYVFAKTPLAGTILVGVIQFPFSILMIRNLVVAHWQAHYTDDNLYFSHCSMCERSVTDRGLKFEDLFEISTVGACKGCADQAEKLSAATPTNW